MPEEVLTVTPATEGFGLGMPAREPETTEIEIPETMHIEQTGPEHPEEPAKPAREPTARELMMKQIIENRAKAQQAEIHQAEVMADEARETAGLAPAPKPIEQSPGEVAAVPPEAPIAPIAAPPAAVPVPQKVKLKVNGIELEVSPEDVTRLAQKGLAADWRFQEAALLRQQPQQNPVQPAPVVAPVAPQQSTQPSLDDNKLKELHRRIQYGSDEEGQQAIRELGTILVSQAQEGRQQQPTPDQIALYAAQQAKFAMDYQAGLTALGNKFPKLFEDDGLAQLAGSRAQQLIGAYTQAGIQKPLFDIWSEACSGVQEKYLKELPAAQPPSSRLNTPSVPNADKLTRKRNAPQLPAAANRTMTTPEAPRAPTGSDIVNRIRQSRGQPAMN